MQRTKITLIATVLLAVASAQAGAQQHYYDLTNGVLIDQKGGPSLVADGVHVITPGVGTSFGSNNGFQVSNIFGQADYSIVMRFSINPLTTTYAKLVDFKNLGTDDSGYYDRSGFASFYNQASGLSSSYTSNVMLTTIVTRNFATKQFTAYVGGVQQFQFTDALDQGLFNATNGVAHFFEDDAHTGFAENGTGVVACISTYNSVLTADAASTLLGCGTGTSVPPTTAPEPSSIALMAAGLLALWGAAKARKRNDL